MNNFISGPIASILVLIMALIPKPKSRSLVVSDPFADELKSHLAMVQQRELEAIKEKLARQQQKQQRVNAIQKQFVNWADKKQSIIRQKIEKSVKLKEDHIKKIVKKCKDHQKYIGQRMKLFNTKKRLNLKEAWKKVEQYNKDNQFKDSNFSVSKNLSHGKSSPKLKTDNQLSQSKAIDYPGTFKKEQEREYLTLSYNNASKYIGNASKQYLRELNQSIRPGKDHETTYLTEIEDNNKEQVPNKLQQTLARFKNFIEQAEQSKIQQLGQRLERIEKTRIRKHELNSKKKHNNRTAFEHEQEERKKAKAKANRSERMHSESYMRRGRVNDWSEANKQKRDQMLQNQIQSGTQYLQEQKFKFMKTSLSKKVAVSAVQKKLYFQRLNR